MTNYKGQINVVEIVKELKIWEKINANYHMYSASELKPFIQNPQFLSSDKGKYIQADLEKGLPDNFEALRRIGENENRICKIIHKDSISEFISYIKDNEYSINSCVPASICETNSLLIKYWKKYNIEKFKLFSYAAYFGSIQIFQYHKDNGVKLRPFLWIHTIHSKRPEIIQMLEESSVKFEDYTCIRYLFESIKCYDKNFVNFFLNKYLNFEIIDSKMIDDSSLVDFCKNGYYSIVQQLLSDKKCQINMLKSMELESTATMRFK